MTGNEIDVFNSRLSLLTSKGLPQEDAEAVAGELLQRDREADDRSLCLECIHLAGYGPSSWRCGAWQRSGVALRARDAGLPADLVLLLQRCDGFTSSPTV